MGGGRAFGEIGETAEELPIGFPQRLQNLAPGRSSPSQCGHRGGKIALTKVPQKAQKCASGPSGCLQFAQIEGVTSEYLAA